MTHLDVGWESRELRGTVVRHGSRHVLAADRVLPAEAIVGFQVLLDEASEQARTWLMWGAAHRILGWCSDDGFDYFRMWLLSLGRTAFAQAAARLPRLMALFGA